MSKGRPRKYNTSREIPSKTRGLYHFVDQQGETLYTGKSSEIKTRTHQHVRQNKKLKKCTIHVQAVKSNIRENELYTYEKKVIQKRNPRLNKRRGGAGRHSENQKSIFTLKNWFIIGGCVYASMYLL